MLVLAAVLGISTVASADPLYTVSGNASGMGEPFLEGVTVEAWSGSGVIDSAVTDAFGNYSLSLPAGDYLLRFDASAYNAAHDDDFAPWWWDGLDWAATAEEATTITLSATQPAATANVLMLRYAHVLGTIASDVDSAPVAGITVRVETAEGAPISSAVTDADGEFLIRSIPAGDYVVRYDTSAYNAANPDRPYLAPALAGPQAMFWSDEQGFSRTLTAVRVSGAVQRFLWGGYPPVSPTTVELWADDTIVATTTTDGSGRYDLFPRPGTYQLRFDPRPYNQLAHQYLSPGWWPNEFERTTASPIIIGDEDPVAACDTVLGERFIVGQVSDQYDGKFWPEGVRVTLTNEQGAEVTSTVTDDNGDFVFTPLPDDTYYVHYDFATVNATSERHYSDQWYPGTTDRGLAQPLTINGSMAFRADLNLLPDARVNGVLSNSLQQPVPGVTVRLRTFTDEVTSTVTGADGSYSLPITPGQVDFLYIDSAAHNAVNDPDLKSGWYWFGMISPTSDNRSFFLCEPLEVREANAVLEDSQAVVGRVVGPQGEPIPDVTVQAVAVPRPDLTEEEAWWLSQAGLAAITDADGSYRIDLEPGLLELLTGVKVQFLPGGDQYLSEWYDDGASESSATSLPMQAGRDAIANVTLSKASTVSGHVLTDAGDPMQWVNVGVRAVGSPYIIWGISDQQGAYRVAGLAPGDYVVEVDPANFNGSFNTYYPYTYWNGRLSEASADPLTVPEATDVEDIDFSLREAVGSVSGHVEDANGEPVTGSSVQAEQQAGPDEESPGEWQVVADAPVGENGDYRFDRIPSGDYRIRFSSGNEGLANEWYDDAHRASEAETVTVETAAETSDVDAVLDAVAHVTGSIHDEQTGAPLNLAVYAFAFDGGEWSEVGRAVSAEEDGSYDLRLPVGGPVRLQFGVQDTGPTNETFTIGQKWYVREAFPDATDYLSGEDIDATLGGTTSVDATLTQAASIAGFVGFNLDLGDIRIDVQRQVGGEWQTAKSLQINEWQFPDGFPFVQQPVGLYMIEGIVPGTYRIRFRDTAGYYLTQYFQDSLTSGAAQLVELGPGEVMPNVDAAMHPGGTLGGRVTFGSGEVPDAAQVDLYRRGPEGSWTHLAQTGLDPDGRFVFRGLESGDYTLVGSADNNRAEVWQDGWAPDFAPESAPQYELPSWSSVIEVYAGNRTDLPEPIALEALETIDSRPPVSRADVPSGWVNHDVIVRFSASDNGASPMGVYAGIGDDPLAPVAALPAISAEGITTVRFRAVDAHGNWESTRTAEVRIDKSPPITDDDALTGYRTKAIVRFYARDRYSGPAETHFALDDEPEMLGTAAVTTEPGRHTLRYWSEDKAGNVEEPREVTFNVGADTTPPVTTPHASAGWTKAPATVTFSADDDNLGVDATFYATDGTTPKYVYLAPVIISTDGVSTVTYRSLDLAGNWEAVRSLEVRVDGTAPVTTASVARATGEATVTLAATDAHSGVARTDWLLDDTVEGSGTVAAIPSAGEHTLEYWSTDAVGNVESTKTLDVTVAEETSLSLSATSTKVVYGTAVGLTGTLLNGDAVAMTGRSDVLGQLSFNGTTWTNIGAANAFGGLYSLSHVPSRLTYYRFVFNTGGADEAYATATSRVISVTVAPTLSLPTVPSGIDHGERFTLWTLMRPKHAVGKSNVTFQFYRLESRKWVLRKTLAATNANSGSATKVSGTTNLSAGSWRVRAFHPADAEHVAAYSAYRSFGVR